MGVSAAGGKRMQGTTGRSAVVRKALALLSVLTSCAYSHAEFSIADDGAALFLYENHKLVLGFSYRSPTIPDAPAQDAPRPAFGYIDPLFDLEGHTLTGSGENGPGGLFWCWAGQSEYGDFDLCAGVGAERVFERKIHAVAEPDRASLAYQYAWLDPSTGGAFAIETVRIDIESSLPTQRLLELEITLRNVSGSVLTLNSPAAPRTVGLHLVTNPQRSFSGVALVPDEEVTTAGNWASVSLRIPRSSRYSGIAIFPSPENPETTRPHWMIPRDGVLVAAWPQRATVALRPGEMYRVRYGLYVHRGQSGRKVMDDAYSEYTQRGSAAREP